MVQAKSSPRPRGSIWRSTCQPQHCRWDPTPRGLFRWRKWDMDGHRMPPFTHQKCENNEEKMEDYASKVAVYGNVLSQEKMSKTQHMQDLEIAHLKMGKSPWTMKHEKIINWNLMKNLDIKFKQQVGAAKLQPQKHNDFTRIRHFTTNAKDCWIRESSLKMADFNLLLFSNFTLFCECSKPEGIEPLVKLPGDVPKISDQTLDEYI